MLAGSTALYCITVQPGKTASRVPAQARGQPRHAGTGRLARLEAGRTNGLRDELANKLLEVTAGSLPGHDLHHLLADLADLTALCIACALHLDTDTPWSE